MSEPIRPPEPAEDTGPASRVLLIVPPFHQAFTPAIGVSLLKAEVARLGIPCDVWYLNLQFAERIGPKMYTSIAAESRFDALAGEWLFAGDLFGEATPEPQRYLDEVLLGRFGDIYSHDFTDPLAAAREWVPDFLEEFMRAMDWDRYAVVGVSSTHQQNCPGLAVLRRVKAAHPRIHTMMGGANCEGQMGSAIHELFPFVDYVCSGEGDQVGPELIRRLMAGESTRGLSGVFRRGDPNLLGDGTHSAMILDLDSLPFPDYDDYFAQFAASSLAGAETPTMALETSRGCWWGEKHQCKFCGLNGGTMHFRAKSPERALAEIDYLVDRHPSRRFYATDNILHFEYFESVVAELAKRPRPPRLYFETKVNMTKQQFRMLARAGFWGLYLGIENLSTSVLRLMDKGTTGLLNIRALKFCAEVGIKPDWAFLCGFPGEDPDEYAQLTDLVPSLTHLRPPVGPYLIRLDRYSPYYTNPEPHGLLNVHANIAYRHVFPFPQADLDRIAYYFDYEYADDRKPMEYTADLNREIGIWQRQDGAARLVLRDLGDHVEIEDTRPAAIQPLTVLEGPARLAYRALDAGASPDAVCQALIQTLGAAAPSENEIRRWLEDWLDHRLVLREGSRYLALAVNPAERVELPVDRFLAQLMGTVPS